MVPTTVRLKETANIRILDSQSHVPSQWIMLERGRATNRGTWTAGSRAALASAAALTYCTSTSKPPGDTLQSNDASVPQPHFDAATHDSALPPADSSGSPQDGLSEESSSVMDAGCEAGQSMCSGACVDTRYDPSNCGQCSNICTVDKVCIAGQCVCPNDGGQMLCNNVCVDLTSDPSNCGACGHFCQGSMCANRLCQPTVVVQAMGAPIFDMAVDSAYVYWTQIAVNTSPGAVSWKPFAGSMTTLTIGMMDPNLLDPRGIAVDTHNMYWVNVANGAVEAVSLVGGKSWLLRPSQTGEGGVTDSPIDITSDGQNVYWVTYDGGQVISEPIDGGPQTVIASGENHPHAITVDATNVYWVNYGNANTMVPSGSVRQSRKLAPFPATGPITLAQMEDQPWDIAVDATSVYWTDHANPGQVRQIPIGGGSAVTLASGQGAPYGIAVDTDYVYWTNFNDKNVLRLAKANPGSTPFALASNQNTPSAIAVDQKNVYWADPGAGTILKVAK